MLARATLAALAVATAALALGGPISPTETATAYCIEIEGVDDCFNPCYAAAGPYNTARTAAGLEDKTPDAHCPA